MKKKKINQCKVSSPLKHWNDKYLSILKIYNFLPYYNKKKPSVFWGLYDIKHDIDVISSHKSLSILVWRGGDILKTNILEKIKNLSNIRHIAISSFIENDLNKYNIKYKFIPLVSQRLRDIKSFTLGNEIYTYIPKNKEEFYGKGIVNEIQKNCKFKINIITGSLQYSKEQLLEIYKRCFIGLRLTPHDGLSNTVIELGLMGRKCIHNDHRIPGTIPWNENNVNEIIENINEEAKNIGTYNNLIIKSINDYIDIGNDWLDVGYWER
jgi:hypothetical protein